MGVCVRGWDGGGGVGFVEGWGEGWSWGGGGVGRGGRICLGG